MTDYIQSGHRREMLQKIIATCVASIVLFLGNMAHAQQTSALEDLRIRRIVTGHDNDGRSFVAIDETITGVPGAGGRVKRFPVWTTNSFPVDNTDPNEGAGAPQAKAAAASNTTVFRILQYNPGVTAPMHRTASIDYAIVISGEIEMRLDDGVVHLRQGDILIQRGTTHNWTNRSSEPCVIAFVMIASEPMQNGEQTLGESG